MQVVGQRHAKDKAAALGAGHHVKVDAVQRLCHLVHSQLQTVGILNHGGDVTEHNALFGEVGDGADIVGYGFHI